MFQTKFPRKYTIYLVVIGIFILIWLMHQSRLKQTIIRIEDQNEYLEPYQLIESLPKNLTNSKIGKLNNANEKILQNIGGHIFGYNLLEANRLPFDRPIPDTRPNTCSSKYLEVVDSNSLKPASIIIPVFNEAYVVLKRTIYSIIERTPSHLIGEIIIVDDSSYMQDTLVALNEVIDISSKLSVMMSEKRKGLVKVKQMAMKMAKYETLVLLESHTEVNVGWLEPLLHSVQSDMQHTVAVPVLDIIDPNTFEYTKSQVVIGGFDWSLHFQWLDNSRMNPVNSDDIREVKTPMFYGGYFAQSKAMYDEFGGFDVGMKMTGPEFMEMSLRTWMCGGRIVVVPCSRVGHVVRDHTRLVTDKHWLTEKWRQHDVLRMARVWMDDWIARFYSQLPSAKDMKSGDISRRAEVRNKLECKSFDWYMVKFFPEEFQTEN